jgi:large subunit ribosomal protein L9
MEVILLEKVRNLGNLGDKVKVKAGFGRNFLIPYRKAVRATAENLAKFESRRAELEKAAAETFATAKQRAEKLAQTAITLSVRATEEGKLFGSIGIREIIKAFANSGVEIAKSEVEMPEGAIRQVGEYNITLRLHSDVNVPVKVNVVAEEVEKHE